MDLMTAPAITVDLEAIHPETQLDPFWINTAAHTLGRLMRSVPEISGTAPTPWECALELAAEIWRDIRPDQEMPPVATQPVTYVVWALGESVYEDETAVWFRAGWDDRPAPAEAGPDDSPAPDDTPVCPVHFEVQPCSHPVHDRGDR